MDESGEISDDNYNAVIKPITSMDGAVCFTFGTPSKDPNHWFSKRIARGGDGIYKVEVVCAKCKRAGRRLPCVHKRDEMPLHTSEARQAENAADYDEAYAAQYEREILGFEVAEDFNPQCFDAARLSAIFARPRKTIDESFDGVPVEYIFVAVDPCGGTTSTNRVSQLAVASIAWSRGRVVLVGLEAIDVIDSHTDFEAVLVEHCERLRANNATLAKSVIVAGVENRSGMEHTRIQMTMTERVPRVELVRNDRRPCLDVTNEIKEQMIDIFNTHIDVHNDDFSIASDLVSVAKPADRVVVALKEQLMRFKAEVQEPKTPNGRAVTTYGGKGKNNKLMDDEAMALLHALRGKVLLNATADVLGRMRRR